MQPAIALPEGSLQRRRGRLQLILILAVVIGPMLLASAMYQWRFWVPETRSFHGELLGTGQTLNDLGVSGLSTERWQLLVTAPGACDSDCMALVYTARQLHIGLNRDVSRASHGLAIAEPLSETLDATLHREYPQLGRATLDLQRYQQLADPSKGAQLWIVDPHGNLVLRYDSSSPGKAILNDLRHLLKISQIG
ncbi:hypothetical protein SAMN05216600_11144 [Pseudomonas cuatrocienegasensis]|uniref:Cytochrome oxidase Cu insertion factor, SCO1/SenC/PrrC family n=1 Tax=Pseudomonas cuatrocienegasensis TaxID=543360 RepID=A0ABY1BHD2_9PSED|nr:MULTISPECIES: hypothetical protein [Pseudomonas]OEC33307.1 hypothetical protein A7D25_19410 [Pseudomonas sp. 21C1]SEQ87815.1 hypothetical protein SAMN05216600_11144 [Pseudomonas cuatrocienegasensis]